MYISYLASFVADADIPCLLSSPGGGSLCGATQQEIVLLALQPGLQGPCHCFLWGEFTSHSETGLPCCKSITHGLSPCACLKSPTTICLCTYSIPSARGVSLSEKMVSQPWTGNALSVTGVQEYEPLILHVQGSLWPSTDAGPVHRKPFRKSLKL